MTAALRSDWAAPEEPQELPPRGPVEPRAQRGYFNSSPWSTTTALPPLQPLALTAPAAGEEGRPHDATNRTAWSAPAEKSEPLERAQDDAPEADKEESQCPMPTACESIFEVLADFAADWFGAVHLQHLSVSDVEDELPEALAAREVRTLAETNTTWSCATRLVNPKLQTTQSLSSTLKNLSLSGTLRSPSDLGRTQSSTNTSPMSPAIGRLEDAVVELPPDGQEPIGSQSKRFYGLEENEPIIVRQFLPIFTCCQCLFVFGLYFICWAATQEDVAGFETIWPGCTDLSLQSDCESYGAQVLYRWWTHQFTHVGFGHVLMNCIMTLFFGINLEGYHGWWRLAIMFNVGVLGGACCYMVSDVHTRVVGMSGGCYALVGMHFGDVLMNWTEQRQASEHFSQLPPEQKQGYENLWRKMSISPWKKLVCLGIMVAIDLIQALLSLNGQTSHSVHFGGFVAGFLICIVVGHNLVVQGHELVFWLAALATGTGLFIFCISWGASWPPRDIFDATPWCWGRQVANRTIFGNEQWHCVRCADHACIVRWSTQRHIEKVSDRICSKAGGWAITER